MFLGASPSSVWKSAQNQRKRNDLAFKAFIWSSGAGIWIPSAGAGFLCGLQYVAQGMSVLHNGAQDREPWSWLQEVCMASQHSGALCGGTTSFPKKYGCAYSCTAVCCWGFAASSSGIMVNVAHLGISVPHSVAKPRKPWVTKKLTEVPSCFWTVCMVWFWISSVLHKLILVTPLSLTFISSVALEMS